MTYELKPCPKPRRKAKRVRRGLHQGQPLKRVRVKAVNRKRGGSSFPGVRDPKYRRWVWTENPCMLRDATIRVPFSTHDLPLPAWGYVHHCWGANTPAHVGKHQATGAPDFGVLVPLCKAAHQFYDEHRSDWTRVTRWTTDAMAGAAEDYGREYLLSGGTP